MAGPFARPGECRFRCARFRLSQGPWIFSAGVRPGSTGLYLVDDIGIRDGVPWLEKGRPRSRCAQHPPSELKGTATSASRPKEGAAMRPPVGLWSASAPTTDTRTMTRGLSAGAIPTNVE